MSMLRVKLLPLTIQHFHGVENYMIPFRVFDPAGLQPRLRAWLKEPWQNGGKRCQPATNPTAVSLRPKSYNRGQDEHNLSSLTRPRQTNAGCLKLFNSRSARHRLAVGSASAEVFSVLFVGSEISTNSSSSCLLQRHHRAVCHHRPSVYISKLGLMTG